MRRVSIALLLLLQGCQRPLAPEERQDVPATAPTSALERAALEAGIVSDTSHISPIGLYQRSHEAGRDLLCLVPGEGKRYRFGLEAIFGTEENCQGSGTARRVGDKLILHFSGHANCIVVAQYEGDRIALPGVLDLKCANLCSSRGSLEGVAFPRLSSDESAARAARDSSEDKLCP
ncbi:hypothetical protein BH10PSE12_BH10PSE12_01170 [soil metagenome]